MRPARTGGRHPAPPYARTGSSGSHGAHGWVQVDNEVSLDFADDHGPVHPSGEINTNDGGRGVYWEDPSGHFLEIITRPYGSGG